MIKRLNILTILLFFACGPPPAKTLTLGYDTNNTRDYLITVVDAVNSYAGCQVLELDNSNFNVRTVFIYEDSEMKALGLYKPTKDNISYRLSPIYQEGRALHTMTHEIGHALGLSHSPDSNRVMFKMLSGPLPIDVAAADMVEYWKENFPKDNICETLKFRPTIESFTFDEATSATEENDCEQ